MLTAGASRHTNCSMYKRSMPNSTVSAYGHHCIGTASLTPSTQLRGKPDSKNWALA